MKNFRINDGSENPQAREVHEYFVGTRLTFQTIGGQLKAAMQIPVQFA